MIPRRLVISGFLSYRERVEIDLSPLHIACITGENGAGKSSLLDAMTWALFGKFRGSSNESVINSTLAAQGGTRGNPPTAEVTFEFEYEGVLYQILRKQPLGRTQIGEFSALNAETGKWTLLTEQNKRGTDSKITELLGLGYDTFVNASFFLQGQADKFTRANATERKKILSEILNLQIWEVYKSKTQERERELNAEKKAAADQLASLGAEIAKEEILQTEYEELLASVASIQAKFDLANQKYQTAQTAEAQFKTQSADIAALEAETDRRFKQIESDKRVLDARVHDLETTRKTLENAETVRADYDELRSIRAQLEAFHEAFRAFTLFTKQEQDAAHEIALAELTLKGTLAALTQRRDELAVKRVSVEADAAKRSALDEAIAEAETTISRRESTQHELDEVVDRMNSVAAENRALKEKMHELKAKLEKLQSAEGAPCPFCGRELDAAHCAEYAGELTAQGTVLGDRYRANEDEKKRLEEEKSRLNAALISVRDAENRKNQLIREQAPLIARRDALEREARDWETHGAAELDRVTAQLENGTFGEAGRKKLADARASLAALSYDAAAHEAAAARAAALAGAESAFHAVERAAESLGHLERDVNERGERLEKDRLDYHGRMDVLNEKRAALETLRLALPDIGAAEAEKRSAQIELRRVQTSLGAAEQRLNAIRDQKEQQSKLIEREKAIYQELVLVTQLNEAFSSNGIPALLIDEALPEIEETANRILGQLTEDRMSVRLTTQGEYKDKKRKDARETLDIIIHDESGARDYELFSGGEAFRVNFAIRLALSALLTKRAGARLQLLVIDEGFGSQDAEGRQRLIQAIHTIQDDYEKIFVITHLDELKDAFQSRIEVVKTETGSEVKVIP